ncbi:phosphoglycerate mutase [Streptomyces hygroscopicus subsp. hygroscopicus]|uniref:histidine phosphatase family protein n=1 Tax=Streptomyces sp. KHY 26 TaxID=3097359 RepID=UPI0024A330FC|nr:histidine phosphatase family protein [Streptomyces hygroscopicus]GLX50445.1 phosphoglycerate mutase [Streptomyces hygroscopicus subsp. hygroscopicus]
MTSRVLLVSPAIGASLRQARFDDGGPLDAGGAARVRAAAGGLPAVARVFVSPGARCRETAAALGLEGVPVPELAGLDVGRWTGRTLEEVGAAEPEAVGRWLADPGCAPHGGESVRDLCARVAARLEGLRRLEGRTLAVVEPEVVRAAAVTALDLPDTAFWRLDVPPLTVTELSGRAGRWNLRLGRPLAASDDDRTLG